MNLVKKLIQIIYDHLRLCYPIRDAVNFFIGRERAFRNRACEACRIAVEELPMSKDGSFIVSSGIFKGMKWPRRTLVGSEFAPKILGTYELEIQDLFRELVNDVQITSFVDIGAAEGYYAVGAAMIRPQLPVFAYEIQEQAHNGIRSLAESNGVSKLLTVLPTFCVQQVDISKIGSKPLVLVDIEGAEVELIDQSFQKLFTKATLLIEVHDFIVPGTGELLRKRLRSTHNVKKISYNFRTRFPLRRHSKLSKLDWSMAADEKRPLKLNYWFYATPKV
jgi:hypothetical protein